MQRIASRIAADTLRSHIGREADHVMIASKCTNHGEWEIHHNEIWRRDARRAEPVSPQVRDEPCQRTRPEKNQGAYVTRVPLRDGVRQCEIDLVLPTLLISDGNSGRRRKNTRHDEHCRDLTHAPTGATRMPRARPRSFNAKA